MDVLNAGLNLKQHTSKVRRAFGFVSRQVDLSRIYLEMKFYIVDNIAEGECIDGKQFWTLSRALGAVRVD